MKSRSGWIWGEVRWWALTGFLLAIPALIVFQGLELEWHQTLLSKREQDVRRLDNIVPASFEGTIVDKVGAFLRETEVRAKREDDPVAAFRDSANRLKKRFPGVFEFLVFDGDGQVIPGFDTFPEWASSIASFGHDLSLYLHGDAKPFNDRFVRSRQILGPFLVCSFETGIETGMYLHSFRPRRAFVWHSGFTFSAPSAFSCLVYVTANEQFPLLGVRLLRLHCKQIHPQLFAELVDLEMPLGRWRLSGTVLRQEILKNLLEREKNDSRPWFSQGRIWRQMALDQRIRTLFSLPESGWEAFVEVRERVFRLFCMAWIVLLIGFRGLGVLLTTVSLRLRLLVLFLYTTTIPLILLGYTAVGLLQDRRENLTRKAFTENEAILNEFARSGLERFGEYEKWCRMTAQASVSTSPGGISLLASRSAQLTEKLGVDLSFVSDQRGKEVFRHLSSAASRSGKGFEGLVRAISPIFSTQCAKRMSAMNDESSDSPESTREQAMKATFESFGIDTDQFTNFMEDFVGQTFTLQLAGERSNLLGFFFHDAERKARFAVMFLWSRAVLGKVLAQLCLDFKPRVPGWWVVNQETLQKEDFCAPPAHFARIMQPGLLEERIPRHERVLIGTMPCLLTGVWDNTLVPISQYLARPEEPIISGVERTARWLGLVALMLLSSGIMVGFLLSRSLLRPVWHLGQGIEAIRRRDFRVRLPVQTHDELGELTETFNRVIDGLGDLEVAKVVQETLFPSAMLSGSGWQISGTCLTASRVGGDYYDYFVLPDGRWLLLIGDVSGHGTAAALVVAMAKAIVCHPDTPPEPATILDIVQNQLVQGIGRRRMMTCFVAIFDPATGILQASNAGHSYPWLIHGDEAVEIRVEHLLLGARTKQPFPLHQMTIAAPDFICFYSDGLVETIDRQGEAIGYARLAESLPRLRHPDAPATVQAILDWRAGLAGGSALEDDVTVMVLQPKGSGVV